jgi:hypothetical protein
MKNNLVTIFNLDQHGIEEVKPLINRAILKNMAFFKIPTFPFKIYFYHSKNKGPNWLVASSNFEDLLIRILTPTAFINYSHRSLMDYQKILTHEISHLFLHQLYSFSEPMWLGEGIGYYVADQQAHPKNVNLKLFTYDFWKILWTQSSWMENVEDGSYAMSYFWVNFLIGSFGKEKFFKLIKNLTPDQNNFSKIFEKTYELMLEVVTNDLIKKLIVIKGEKNGKYKS